MVIICMFKYFAVIPGKYEINRIKIKINAISNNRFLKGFKKE